MRRLLLAGLLTLAAGAAAAGDLTVTVTGVRGAKGSVLGALYAGEAAYLKPPPPDSRFRLRAGPGPLTYVFHGLAPGRYALAVFHDANDNGKLDRNLFGLPVEGYGFSNNARAAAGPPPFARAAFDIDGRDRTIAIVLNAEP